MPGAYGEDMDEKLPTEHGELRPEISELVEAEGWLPAGFTDEDDDPQRPETD